MGHGMNPNIKRFIHSFGEKVECEEDFLFTL